MAQFISTTFGDIKGKHGTAIAYMRDGKNLLKKYVVPRNPNSEKQQIQRLKFKLVANTLKPLRKPISIGFGNYKGFFKASAIVIKNGIMGEFPNFEVDYSSILIANGTLPQLQHVKWQIDNQSIFTLQWDNATINDENKINAINLVFLNEKMEQSLFFEEVAQCNQSQYTITLPNFDNEKPTHFWLFVTNPQKSNSSISQYYPI